MLHCVLVEARNLKRSDLFSQSDPFCIVDFGNQQVRSKVILNNQNPIWNEYFTFAVNPHAMASELTIRVYDHDTLDVHDHLGTAQIPLSSLNYTPNQWVDKWIPLAATRKGEIHLRLKLDSMNMQSATMGYGMGMPQHQSNSMMMGSYQPQMMPQQYGMNMQSATMGYGMPQHTMMMPQQSMMMQQQQQPYTGMMPSNTIHHQSTMYPSSSIPQHQYFGGSGSVNLNGRLYF